MSKSWSKRLLTAAALVSLAAGTQSPAVAEPDAVAALSQAQDQLSASRATALHRTVVQVRRQYKIPALTAAVMHRGAITSATVGHVRAASMRRVAPNARFHLGSLSKGVLSTAIGSLIEDGSVRFSTTLAEVFPGRVDKIRPALRDVTLRELLTHRSGLAAYTNLNAFAGVPTFAGNASQKQSRFAWWLLGRKPAFTQGSWHYSNAGYTVAAQVAEKVSGRSWQSLVRNEVFRPLGIPVWFGWPGVHGPRQPWGHVVRKHHLVPVGPGQYHLPTEIAPAGNLSLSARGVVRYLRVHVAGLRGNDTAILRARTIRALHHPFAKIRYSCGWFEATLEDGTPISIHDGTAGTFYAFAAVLPTQRRAVVSAANVGGRRGSTATSAVIATALGLSSRAAGLSALTGSGVPTG